MKKLLIIMFGLFILTSCSTKEIVDDNTNIEQEAISKLQKQKIDTVAIISTNDYDYVVVNNEFTVKYDKKADFIEAAALLFIIPLFLIIGIIFGSLMN